MSAAAAARSGLAETGVDGAGEDGAGEDGAGLGGTGVDGAGLGVTGSGLPVEDELGVDLAVGLGLAVAPGVTSAVAELLGPGLGGTVSANTGAGVVNSRLLKPTVNRAAPRRSGGFSTVTSTPSAGGPECEEPSRLPQ